MKKISMRVQALHTKSSKLLQVSMEGKLYQGPEYQLGALVDRTEVFGIVSLATGEENAAGAKAAIAKRIDLREDILKRSD
jgi:hypothetical protein